MGINYNPNIVTNGLVLALDASNQKSYSGSGTLWYDLGKNGYTHTLNNSPLTQIDGVLCFDSSSSGKYIQKQSSTYTFTTEYTLICWAWAISDATATTWRTLWRTSAYHPILIQDGTDLIGGYYGGFRSFGYTAASIGASENWTMYVIVASGGNSTFYINDCSIGGNSIGYSENTRTHNSIGTYSTGAQPFGYISSASIYNRPLSIDEIKQIFNATRGRYGI